MNETLPRLAVEETADGPPLRAYLLGQVPYEEMIGLQRRFHYEVSEGEPAALALCEHPPIVTVGRHGSHAQMDLDDWESWRGPCIVRWVNRAGGCWLHMPGQLAIYAILPLDRMGLGLRAFVSGLQKTLLAVLGEFDLKHAPRTAESTIWTGTRPIACCGSSVRDWISGYGAVLNLDPELDWYRMVRTGRGHPAMTCLQREARRPIRASMVRERLIEHFAQVFAFGRVALFMEHPSLNRKTVRHAIPAAR